MSDMAFSSTNALATDNCDVDDGFGFGDGLVTGHFEIGNCSLSLFKRPGHWSRRFGFYWQVGGYVDLLVF